MIPEGIHSQKEIDLFANNKIASFDFSFVTNYTKNQIEIQRKARKIISANCDAASVTLIPIYNPKKKNIVSFFLILVRPSFSFLSFLFFLFFPTLLFFLLLFFNK